MFCNILYCYLHLNYLTIKKQNKSFYFPLYRFHSHLEEMFSEKPEWDIEGKYSADSVNVYFELLNDYKTANKVTKIEIKSCSLSEALTLLR